MPILEICKKNLKNFKLHNGRRPVVRWPEVLGPGFEIK